jgi:hypothetical protein
MNERIMEFARESHLDVYALGKDHAKWKSTLEKFTELIVKRCAEVADQYVRDGDIDIAKLIKRDFGVEE